MFVLFYFYLIRYFSWTGQFNNVGISQPLTLTSYVAIIGIPWSFKILIAPLMDRYSFLPMGRRRPWIIFGQLGLLFAFIGLATVPEPLTHLHILMAAGFCVSLFSAFRM